MALILSQYNTNFSYFNPSFVTKPVTHKASLVPSTAIINYASIVDKAAIGCNIAFQLIGLPTIIKRYPVVDFLLSKSPT